MNTDETNHVKLPFKTTAFMQNLPLTSFKIPLEGDHWRGPFHLQNFVHVMVDFRIGYIGLYSWKYFKDLYEASQAVLVNEEVLDLLNSAGLADWPEQEGYGTEKDPDMIDIDGVKFQPLSLDGILGDFEYMMGFLIEVQKPPKEQLFCKN